MYAGSRTITLTVPFEFSFLEQQLRVHFALTDVCDAQIDSLAIVRHQWVVTIAPTSTPPLFPAKRLHFDAFFMWSIGSVSIVRTTCARARPSVAGGRNDRLRSSARQTRPAHSIGRGHCRACVCWATHHCCRWRYRWRCRWGWRHRWWCAIGWSRPRVQLGGRVVVITTPCLCMAAGFTCLPHVLLSVLHSKPSSLDADDILSCSIAEAKFHQ